MNDLPSRSRLRGYLVLARASNLPTVWSNCIAGWLLSGNTSLASVQLLLVCLAGSLLYTGGMFLNDAFDVEFDRAYRKERPIPSGIVSASSVWIYGLLLLGFGVGIFFYFGSQVGLYSLALVAAILAYDALHKKTMLSPLLMGVCRFLLYLTAASAGNGINSTVMCAGAILAFYIVGLSYVAKSESAPGPLRYWPLLFLASPIAFHFGWEAAPRAIANSSVVGAYIAWLIYSLRPLFRATNKNVGAAISALLAGIILVDCVLVGAHPIQVLVIFLYLFISARLFQKFVPAT